MASDVNDRNGAAGGLGPGSLSDGVWHQSPQAIEAHRRAVVFVAHIMEMTHPDLSEISRMISIKKSLVMMLSTSVTTSARMLAMLSHTPVTRAYVTSFLSIFFCDTWLRITRRTGRKEVTLARVTVVLESIENIRAVEVMPVVNIITKLFLIDIIRDILERWGCVISIMCVTNITVQQ